MRGGFRPGAGRPPGSKDGVQRCRRVQYAQNEHVELVLSEPEPQAVTNHSGQEWLRLVINDSSADPIRRDRAAMAMSNIEARAAQALGKKAAADEAAKNCHLGTQWEKLLTFGHSERLAEPKPAEPSVDWNRLLDRPLVQDPDE
jgi:hypothetical protein